MWGNAQQRTPGLQVGSTLIVHTVGIGRGHGGHVLSLAGWCRHFLGGTFFVGHDFYVNRQYFESFVKVCYN